MSERHQAVGIKQIIRLEWLDKTTALLMAGLDAKAIRTELKDYLNERDGSGNKGRRSQETRNFVVRNLMMSWVNPDKGVLPLRDAGLRLLEEEPGQHIPIHWAILSAAYPFWFHVSLQVGRVLRLQEHVALKQIQERIKEVYGDRQTVSRSAQRVIRSLVALGFLEEKEGKGIYRAPSEKIAVAEVTVPLLVESMLLARNAEKLPWVEISGSPALFPFDVPFVGAGRLVTMNPRLETHQFSFGEEYVGLKG